MNRSVKKVLTGSCLFIAAGLLSFASLSIFLNSDSARFWLQEKISAAIPGTVGWYRHTVSLFSGEVAAESLFLRDKTGVAVLSLPKLEVKIFWPDILRGILTFESIQADGLQVQLHTDSAGRLNLFESLQESDASTTHDSVLQRPAENTGFPFNLAVRKADLRNGNLQFYENAAHRLNLPQIDLELENGDLQKEKMTIAASLVQPEIHFDGVPVRFTAFRIEGTFVRGQIPRFAIRGETAGGSGFKASGKIRNLYTEIEPDAAVELDGDLKDILKVFSIDTEIGGTVAGKATIQGGLSNPAVFMAATCRDADFYGTKVNRLGTTVHWKDGVVTVREFTVKLLDSTLAADGTVNLQTVLPDGLLSDAVAMDQIRYRLAGSLATERIDGKSEAADGIVISAHSKFAVNGRGIFPSARKGRVTLETGIRELKKEAVLLISNMTVSGAVDYENQNINVVRLDIRAGEENHVEGSGRLRLDSGAITGKVSVSAGLPTDRIRIPAIGDLKGNLQISGSIAGTMDKPAINGFLQAEDVFYRDVRIGTVIADYAFSPMQLGFQNARIRNANSELALSGTISLPSPKAAGSNPVMDVAIHGDALLLQDFSPQLDGRVSIHGAVSGEMVRPEGELQVTGENLSIYGQTVKGVKLNLHADKAKITVDDARIAVREEEEIQVAGWVSPYQEEYGLRVFSDGISLRSIDSISGMNWGAAQVDFAVTGQGRFTQPAVSGKIGVASLFTGEKGSDRFEAQIDFSDGKLRVAASGGKEVAAKIDFDTGEMDANANLHQIQLAPWLKMAGLDQFSGSMDMALEISGQYRDPETITGEAVLSDTTILWEEKELLRADRFEVNMKNGKLVIPQNRLAFTKNGYLNVEGEAGVSGMVDIRLAGSLPARILELATDEISDMDGALSITAAVEGAWKNPSIRSAITVQNVRGRLPYLSEEVRDLKGEIRIRPDRITVDGLEGRSGAGGIALNGSLDIAAYPDVTAELILRSHALPVEISELSVLLNSNLSLHLAKENRRLSGELVILEGEYTRDVDINPIAAVTERTRKVALLEKHADQGLLDGIEMDITIKSRHALVVDNNISLLQLKPDLHIQGSAAQPVFTGRAEVDSGTISYQRREFTVTKGVVDFINPYKIEPHIDVEGEAQIRQWKIYLTVKGVPENLKVTLRSVPDLPNGDILSILVFGKTVREFIEGEGGQSASPAELLAALMSDRLQTGVKDATGLDSVEVGYSSNGAESNSSRMKIEVGKDLSRYVTVKYGIETTNSKIVQRAITEYRFLEHLILEAYQNSEGDYGGELQYRLEFR